MKWFSLIVSPIISSCEEILTYLKSKKEVHLVKKFLIPILAVALVASVAMAADLAQPAAGGTIIADFEEFNGVIDNPKAEQPAQGPYVWWIYNDADAGKSSSIRGEIVNDAVHGSKALKIGWTLDGWTGLGWMPNDPKIVWDWSQYKSLSFWVKSSGSKERFVIELDDVNKEVFWSALVKADSTEWTKVVIPFKQIRARSEWQPADAKKNSVIDWPVQMQIVPQTKEGSVTIDYFEAIP